MSPEHWVVLSVLQCKTQILLLSISEMSQMSQDDILDRLGLNMTVTRGKGKPPGPGTTPIGGAAADPGKAPPAAAGGAEGSESGGA